MRRCPHCVTFKPKIDATYRALKEAHGDTFEVVYVSSDQSRGAFDGYFGTMGWYAVPFEAREVKEALDAKFDVSGIPTVVMLRRSKLLDGRFALVEGGMEGRAVMGGVPAKAVADFPWGESAREGSVLQLARDLGEIEQSLSLVLLCEHLLPHSRDYASLVDMVNQVAEKYDASNKVADGQWPRLKFFAAAGPASEPTRWLRAEAQLPQVGDDLAAGDVLEVLVIDNTVASPVAFSMRGLCRLWDLPFNVGALLAEGGRLLRFFLESFCNDIHPLQDEASELRNPPVMGRFGLAAGSDGVSSHVVEDAAADRAADF